MLHIPSAFKHRRYTAVWVGQLISIAGSQMQVAAIHWQIRDLSSEPNPLALGGIGLARIIPVIVFSLFGGAFADTYNRRAILFITQSIMALTAVALAALTFNGAIHIWQIYLLTAIQAAAMAFDAPARQAIVPGLVPKEDLPNAFSLNSIAFNTGAVLGPMLSGLVIAWLGIGYAYLINAISFLAYIIALVSIGPIAQDLKKASGVSIKAMQEGLRFIFSRKIILSTMVMDFFATFFASTNTLMPIVARDILQVGEIGYGLLASAQSIGSVVAGVIISQMGFLRRQGPVFLISVVVFGVATIWFGLVNSLVMALLALMVMGAADAVSTIIRNTIRQLNTPDHIRGRMTSINMVFFQGGPQLGEVEAGIVAQLLGVPFAIISGGIGTIIAAGLIIKKWPLLKTYNGDEPMQGELE